MDARTTSTDSDRQPELWQVLADNIPQLAWIADPTGHIYWYNRRWFDFTGTSLAEMEGWGWKKVHHPDVVDRVVEGWSSALRSGEAWEDIFPLRRHDGVFRTFLSRANPIRNASGDVTHWFGTNTDITDQREQQRRDSFLLRLEDEIAAANGVEELKSAAVRLLGHELGADRVMYTAVDVDEGHFRVDRQYLAPGVPSVAGTYSGEEYGRIILLYSNGEPVVVTDIRTDPRYAPIADEEVIRAEHVRAMLDVPIIDDGRLVSILSVHDLKAREWTAEEVELVRRTAQRTRDGIRRGLAEEALKRSEQRFARATRAAGMFAWENDPRTGKVSWGEGAADILRVEGPMPDDGMFFVRDEDRERLDAEFAETQAQRRNEHAAEFTGKDGRSWVAEMAVTYDGDGQAIAVYGVTRDVSAEEGARSALAASEAQFRSTAEALPGILFVTDDVGRNIYVNEHYRAYSGLSEEQLLGEGWAGVIHPDDEVVVVEATEEARRSGGRLNAEYRLRRHDGSYRWHRTQAAPIRDQRGKIERWVGVSVDVDDARTAEADLRRSEERYRTLFESMEQGFCVIDVAFDRKGDVEDYRFVEINPAFSRESGLPDEVVGRSVLELLPGLEQVWLETYAEVARSGKSHRFVQRAEALDRTFEVFAFRIGDPAKHHVAVLFTDISERIRQEDALRRSEQDMRMRLNAIPQMVWSTLPDGYHDFYNDRWYEFTGTPLGSTDGEGWNGMFHPEDQPRAWERWNHSLATGEPYEIEYRLRHHTGNYRWVLGRALPILDEAGAVQRWMGTCTDIDDRIAADRALRESEARLRAVFDSMPVGLVFADSSGAVTGGNQRVEEIIGQRVVPSQTAERYARDYIAFHGDGRQVESHEYPLARVIRGEEVRPELECLVQRSDGEQRWVRYVAAPIVDDDGQISGGVVASLDIDREKRLTESLEREVERVVAEREAAQEALRQSQKLESMGQLTGGVAHDFNNLLTPIIGSLDLLQRKQQLDDRTGRLVEGALASAEKARVLVQRLLAFARRQPLQPQAVDLGRIVAEMSELVDSTSGPRVRVDVAVPDDLPPALADGNQLEMALLNLSVNARDAMPDGGTLTIGVRVENKESAPRLGLRAEPHLVLSVSDTGSGMDEETRRRAIEPFFSTKGVGKGTGLGLSMVHGLAAQLGGALDIRSAPGMGTTIELWLPVARNGLAADPVAARESEKAGAGIALLVDDEELVRASTASMLTDLGYDVVDVDSGEEAVRRVRGGLRPDLLITDQLMPGLSGTDLAVRLREQVAHLPVLIVSGYADLESLSPAFPHLSKPFRQAELAAALEKLRHPAG